MTREPRLLLGEREVVRRREPELEWRRIGVDAHEVLRLGVRQGSQHRRADRAENRSRGAKTDAYRDDNRQRQDGRAQQAAESDAEIVREILEQQCALHVLFLFLVLAAAILARRIQIPELTDRLTRGVFARHTLRDEL